MYIITRKDVYKPANKVYFSSNDLLDAVTLRDDLNKKTPGDWIIAEVFDERSWFGKFLVWLSRKTSKA